MTALDTDPELLEALRVRAEGLPVTVVQADARDFALDRHFALCLIPMQTIQLMGGERGRTALLHRVRSHLEPGALLAAAVADALEGFDEDSELLPLPDMGEQDGWLYSSQPIAIRDHGDRVAIERIRQAVAPDGSLDAEGDVVELDRLDGELLEREGEAAGFTVQPAITATTPAEGDAAPPAAVPVVNPDRLPTDPFAATSTPMYVQRPAPPVPPADQAAWPRDFATPINRFIARRDTEDEVSDALINVMSVYVQERMMM